MNLIQIANSADPRISPYLNIRERDLVGRHGKFVAEGEVVLNVLIDSNFVSVDSVFICESRLDALETKLARLGNVPIYFAKQELMSQIVGFPIHRGILAIARRNEEPTISELLATVLPQDVVLCLMGIANHDNMGGIFRNAAAFGVKAVLLDQTCCDPLYRKAIRVSVGGVLCVPFAKGASADEIIFELRRHNIRAFALSPHAQKSIRHQEGEGHASALILGSEGHGLKESILEQCDARTIPMASGFDSLNVATASGIALYEMCVR